MVRCARCCLQKSIRIVNLIILLLAIGMIIYSLWLQKKWNGGVAQLPATASFPRPWFILTCLGVGIAACLSTVVGHMVSNCISHSTLCIYIVTIISLLLLELAVVVAIFFRMDWKMLFAKLIDKYHTKFKIFLLFHLKMCRFVTILILVPQINVLALVVISLWAIGTEQRRHRNDSEQASIIQSFLVRPNSPVPDTSRHACCSCENLPEST
ncbi:hypothetical protein CICLE_v10010490mg [Citrus x clementina]|uniref:Tetraspanin-19-like n=2 Tax=Citrus clementina TaxID=85681 RepID=V4WBV9_CITCL|nr:hypothetical protein CICLE_v10010490mg [Citrus x clementina]